MIQIFGFTFVSVVLPIFIQIIVGYFTQKKFRFDLRTLSKSQFYIFIPALVFNKLYSSNLGGDLLLKLIAAAVMLMVGMLIIAFSVGLAFRLKKKQLFAFAPPVVLYNSGNFCLPLMELLYNSDPFVMSVQSVIMASQNIFQCTVGVFCAGCGTMSVKETLSRIVKLPIIYACIAAAIFKGFSIPVWTPVLSATRIMGECLVPLALLTLGAQLAEVRMDFKDWRIFLSMFLRLLVAPCLMFGVVRLLGITGIAAQALVIISAAPSAVNNLIIAMEYGNEVEYTGKTVFASTVVSSFTVTLVICIVRALIPV